MQDTTIAPTNPADQLVRCEEIIDRNRRAFEELVGAVGEIENGELYRIAGYATLGEYLRGRWSFSRQHVHRLIQAAETMVSLSPTGDKPLPTNERQVRELAKAAPVDRPAVWEEALRRAPEGEAPTGRIVREVVDAFQGAESEEERARLLLSSFGPKAIAQAHKTHRAEKDSERRAERIDRIAAIAAGNGPLLLGRKFAVILGDPAWPYRHAVSDSRAIENHYPTMSLEDICALPVREHATDDALLFLWVPPGMSTQGARVLEAWGFEERSSWVWVKPSIGPGYWGRLRHELLLIGVRGDFPTPPPDLRFDSVVEAPRGAHSEKPAEVAERIEAMYPTLPKLELFCRSPREGWTAWGNQAQQEGVA